MLKQKYYIHTKLTEMWHRSFLDTLLCQPQTFVWLWGYATLVFQVMSWQVCNFWIFTSISYTWIWLSTSFSFQACYCTKPASTISGAIFADWPPVYSFQTKLSVIQTQTAILSDILHQTTTIGPEAAIMGQKKTIMYDLFLRLFFSDCCALQNSATQCCK